MYGSNKVPTIKFSITPYEVDKYSVRRPVCYYNKLFHISKGIICRTYTIKHYAILEHAIVHLKYMML